MAVLSATSALVSNVAVAPMRSTMERRVNASLRREIFTPASVCVFESSGAKRPLTKTSRAAPGLAAGSSPANAEAGAARYGVFRNGARLVYFHASLCVVGNPRAPKRSIAAWRVRRRRAPPGRAAPANAVR